MDARIRRLFDVCDQAFSGSGIASHDLYHAGQIQLLKRLHKR